MASLARVAASLPTVAAEACRAVFHGGRVVAAARHRPGVWGSQQPAIVQQDTQLLELEVELDRKVG